MSTLPVIRRVLSVRPYGLTCVGAGAAFGLAYMITTGMLMFFPQGLGEDVKTPYFLIYDTVFQLYQGSPSIFVWIIPKSGILWIPASQLMLSIDLAAAIFIFSASLLIGIIAALMRYSLREARCSCRKEAALGVAGAVPALLATFACCGGGLLMLALGSSAFIALSFYYSKPFMAISILLLVLAVRSLVTRLHNLPAPTHIPPFRASNEL